MIRTEVKSEFNIEELSRIHRRILLNIDQFEKNINFSISSNIKISYPFSNNHNQPEFSIDPNLGVIYDRGTKKSKSNTSNTINKEILKNKNTYYIFYKYSKNIQNLRNKVINSLKIIFEIFEQFIKIHKK